MQPLSRDSHVERVRTDQLFGKESWVGVDISSERVATHVLHSTG